MDNTVQSLIEANLQAFEVYFDLLVEWNEKINLTSITERGDVFVKHFYDSLLVHRSEEWKEIVDRGARVMDIGTGAGFPGIPLAICNPSVSFVLCDSLQKRIWFLNHVVSELSLNNVQTVHGRAEDVGRSAAYRHEFDGVVSRAVARLNVLAEITMPFASVGGIVFAYKGPRVEDELPDGRRAVQRLGGRIVRVEHYDLPGDHGERNIVLMRQDKQMPKTYPRKAGTPQKQPL